NRRNSVPRRQTRTSLLNVLYLHDALPICELRAGREHERQRRRLRRLEPRRHFHPRLHRSHGLLRERAPRQAQDAEQAVAPVEARSEEHTSELQSQSNLVCRLLLEKKKKIL